MDYSVREMEQFADAAFSHVQDEYDVDNFRDQLQEKVSELTRFLHAGEDQQAADATAMLVAILPNKCLIQIDWDRPKQALGIIFRLWGISQRWLARAEAKFPRSDSESPLQRNIRELRPLTGLTWMNWR
jgi:hypothetical protein